MTSELRELTDKVVKFREERNWEQFHTLKNIVLSLFIEAGELAEHFQWREGDELRSYLKENRHGVEEELADVLYWLLLLAHDLEIDLPEAFQNKMKKNSEKYPIEKAYGRSSKYTEL